jgi:DNA-binding transcriptional LysR family regulator
MDIHQLKIFVSVFKNKSFSKASEQLHLTQPTVSEHIRTLEEELDLKLFDRAGRLVIPTKEAELLYPRAMEIIEKVKDMKSAVGRFKEQVSGELVIGASTIPGTYIIPSLASKFKRKYPEVSFHVVIGDSKRITEMVLNHEILLGIVGAKMDKGRVEYVPFVEDELVLAALPGLIAKTVIAPGELAGIPFLLREEGSGTRKTMEKHLSEKGISLDNMNVVAVLGSTDSIKEAVKSGLGASILSRLAIREELKEGRLKEIRIRGLSMKRSFYIITHKRRTLPKQYQAFFEYLKKK